MPDVRTLLLCKINSHAIRDANQQNETDMNQESNPKNVTYRQAYRNIYCGRQDSPGMRFLTLGSFDAMSIYSISPIKEGKWLQAIYEDRQQISSQLDKFHSYHPIHLVSFDNDYRFWEKAQSYPYCVATLAYGSQNKKRARSTVIVSELLRRDTTESSLIFSVYQALNICDVVVFMFSYDIDLLLKKVYEISTEIFARKTYTAVGLRLHANGDLPRKNAISIETQSETAKFNLRIHGSIRDYSKMNDLFFKDGAMLWQELDKNHRSYSSHDKNNLPGCFSSYGNEDFEIPLLDLSIYEVNKLIDFLMENDQLIATACWEIHTDWLRGIPSNNSYSSTKSFHHHIFTALYDEYTHVFNAYLKHDEKDWAPAYYELLGVLSNNARHPILYEPSFLLYKFVSIANDYFKKAESSQVYRRIIKESNDNIQAVIRNWSQLMEQLNRTDDLIFYGVGSSLTIYNAPPEGILDFYHSYLCYFIDALITADSTPRSPEFDYAFLLIPEQSQRMRVSHMFSTQTLYHEAYEQKSKPNAAHEEESATQILKSLWPEKQVYLVEFPTSQLYAPKEFVFSIMHECYHLFGDCFRLRPKRVKYLVAITTQKICDHLDRSQKWYDGFRNLILKKLAIKKEDLISPEEPHLIDTCQSILKKLTDLFNVPIETISKELNESCYYEDADVKERWRELAFSDSRSPNYIWKNFFYEWIYLFRECYADIMTMLSLNVKPEDYYFFVEKEVNQTEFISSPMLESRKVRVSLRIAMVVAAFSFNTSKLTEETLNSSDVYLSLLHSGINLDMKTRIEKWMQHILIQKPYPKEPREFSAAQVQYLFDYLQDVKRAFHCFAFPKLQELRMIYQNVFVKEKLFGDSYFTIINDNRKRIASVSNA